ncbi:hypothetical protein A9K55_003968 [Cordyceps militaris]|uniref:Uncharacterized protein n=1 Tax=Cordyceps militaris TaxID=73501 RepID=A0A2H4SL32_CORMI|nr:hypothetical protein A9K55_003968 [Cordyceps militaris]
MDSGPRKKEEKPLVQDHHRQPSCECNHAFGRARQDAPKDGDPDGAQVQQIRSIDNWLWYGWWERNGGRPMR